jgi:2-amino-4-hydroxy-6-hydroxymethyldihydropteridine diphosphokinase
MKYFLGLGSNLQNRKGLLYQAIEHIKNLPETKLLQESSLIETKAEGNPNQPDFINCVIEIETEFQPEELMNACLEIEKKMGRIRKKKWEPRLIDIDILLFEDGCLKSEKVTIPHPLCHKRRFVLQSLVEICPECVHPIQNKSMKELLEELS